MPRKSVTAVLGDQPNAGFAKTEGLRRVLGAPNLRICTVREDMTEESTMAYTKAITLLDGAMGTMLQKAGLKLGDRPETLSITAADVVERHTAAVCAGGDAAAAGEHLLRERA